jgi:hypothetical protein
MSAKSKNPYDVLVWLKKVVDSCTTVEHCDSACNLIENFKSQYSHFDNWSLYNQATRLRQVAFNKSLDLIEERMKSKSKEQ